MTEQHPSRMGHPPDFVTEPSTAPIYQTTAFDVPDLKVLADIYSGNVTGHVYTRDSNPNHAALSDSIAAMEGAEAGCVFSSGMGAIAAVSMHLAGSGDHIIVAKSLYGITLKLIGRLHQKFGVHVSYVDAGDSESIKAALQSSTKMCLVETISNPLLEVTDIRMVADTLGDVPLVVDSTFTTPELIRPIEHGATIVVHSASKYLNGHGDVMLGVAAGTIRRMKSVRSTASAFGQNGNPFESWLTQRGLKTLPLRMKQICNTTTRLAEFLQGHAGTRHVFHPSLPEHGTHRLATELYPNGTGGIISFCLAADGKEGVSKFMQAAENIPFSPTLADPRTTLSHPATTSHAFMSRQDRASIGITDELVRLSVGLESFEVLRDELGEALSKI
ncbi:MAG TPA: aminotransferase class I/II-fold pyridoxal phosphate-dependent enzyme [Planctomycetes bacterium]|nr:aminotransferase class I/II-fold pyridoxal phosphate-dependent enzyme [Fuerstiella sp.]HIK93294.1 aminotransferase class I/II-fold pyridoxal phosphate-dependent enzyme [Planctomycetota bacterium]